MPAPHTWKVIDADALRKATLVTKPYPYLLIDNFILPEVLTEVVNSFPVVPKRGSVPLDAVSSSGAFAALMDEMHSPELRELIGERLGKTILLNVSALFLAWIVGLSMGVIAAAVRGSLLDWAIGSVTAALQSVPGVAVAQHGQRVSYRDDLRQIPAVMKLHTNQRCETTFVKCRLFHPRQSVAII